MNRSPPDPDRRAMPTDPAAPPVAVLLIAHGSRRPEANADLDFIADELRRRGRYAVVEAAYLELAEPDIDAGAAACVERGARTVILVPYFLSPGVHVCEDLAEARRRLGQRFPGVRFRLAEPLGRHPLLAEIVAERAAEAE
jgi:sirohydrochlorin ferrochelatase